MSAAHVFMNSVLRRSLFLWVLATSIAFTSPARAAIAWGSAELFDYDLKMFALVDDSSQKAYFRMSGPSNAWFGWGFGNDTMQGYAIILNTGTVVGNYFESTMQGHVQPQTDPMQETSGTYCVTNGIIYYSLERTLTPVSSSHFTFSTQPTNFPVTWAVGTRPFNQHYGRDAATLASSNAPIPGFSRVTPGSGTLTLSVTNLLVTVTNRLEMKTNLNSADWTALMNLVFTGPCGSQLFTIVTNLAVPTTNAGAGFFRVRQ